MNSLRVFSQQNKNCYILSSTSMDRYFIRAMFNYGNYDGLSFTPTFNLHIDGNKIKTIKTIVNNITYFEVIYTSRGIILLFVWLELRITGTLLFLHWKLCHCVIICMMGWIGTWHRLWAIGTTMKLKIGLLGNFFLSKLISSDIGNF